VAAKPPRATQPTGRTEHRGVLVAVEGIDHTGKTTLAAALTAALRAKGTPVAGHVEPGRGPVGAFFRAASTSGELPARAMAMLSTAARQAEQAALGQLLAEHDVVVSDRYYLSGLAYHAADGVLATEYQVWNKGIHRPDVYLVLHAKPEVRAARAPAKPDGYWESPAIAGRLPAAYASCVQMLRASEKARVIPIDADTSPAEVLAQALHALAPLVPVPVREGITP
jgi:dTMP kinase